MIKEPETKTLHTPRRLRVSGLLPHLSDRFAQPHPAPPPTEGLRKPRFVIIKRAWQFVLRHKLHYAAGVLVLVLLVLQVAIFTANLFRGSQPILGLRFHGHAIANFNRAQLAREVDGAISQAERDPLVVQAGTTHTRLTARQLGARYSTNAIVAGIYATGRTGNLWGQLVAQDAAVLGAYAFRLGFPNINTGLTLDFLKKLNDAAKRAPSNAGIMLKNGHLTIIAGTPGYEVDLPASIKALKNYDESLDMNLLDLPLKKLPPIIAEKDVRSVMSQLKRMTDMPLQVKAGKRMATISRTALVNTISIESRPDPRHPTKNKPTIVIDQTDADKISATLALQLNHNAETKIVDGATVIKPGGDGDVIDGVETKIALITHLLLRQQLVVDGNKPLVLNSHHIAAPVLPNVPSLGSYGGALSARTANKQARVILSFEGMPNAIYGPQILDALKRANVHAVFFGVGRNVASYPDIVKRIVNEGHTLGVSTYTYRDLNALPQSELDSEINQSVSAVTKVTGVKPTIFRSPRGGSSDQATKVLQQAGLTPVNWTVDALDWANLPADFITKQLLTSVKPGSIVMLHSLNEQTVVALPQIIEGLKKKGYAL